VNHGSQADKVQYEAVQKYIAIGKETGKIALGEEAQATEASLLVHPVIFLVLPGDNRIMKEEIFGPVFVNTFKTEEAVIAKTNDTEFGLYEVLYTKDFNRALKVAKKLESGMTVVNTASLTEDWDLPSGGYKGSGTGRAYLPFPSPENICVSHEVLLCQMMRLGLFNMTPNHIDSVFWLYIRTIGDMVAPEHLG